MLALVIPQSFYGSFPLSPPAEAVATATSVLTEYIFCESVGSAHNLQISSTFQEANCLLKLVNQTGTCSNFIKQKLGP